MYTREMGRKIKYIQGETAASTAVDVVSDHQLTSNINVGDFCTIQCTTGTMYFLTSLTGTVLTTDKNGWEMGAGDMVDFIAPSTIFYTLSTANDGKFQLVVWEG